MNIHERIKARRIALGLSQEELAERAGVTRAAVQQWENGKTAPSRKNAAALMSALRQADPNEMGNATNQVDGLIYTDSSAVPLKTWKQVAMDEHTAGGSMMPCPLPHGPSTYALVVKGTAMSAPESVLSFSPGDVIFVDPDRKATNGDLIVLKLKGAKEAIMRQLLIEEGAKLIQALNPSWPNRIAPLPADAAICGPVIGKVQSFVREWAA